MTDRIKVSQLPLVNAASLSINDVFIINDSDRGDGQTITSGIKYSDVIGSIASQDINFTGDIVFSGDVVLNGTITPSPGKELNITLDNVTINDSLTINAGATISGIKLSDLDDTTIVSQTGNQLLIWDQGEQAWRNFTLQQIVDNVEDLDLENINNIEMTGDLTMDGDLSVGGDLSVSGNISGIGINDLDDVRTPLPIIDGRFLRWEQDIQQWIPATISIDDIGGGIANPPGDGSVYGRGFVSGNYEWIKAAPIDSPVFEGTPTCPVPTSTDTGLSIVNKQYVSDILTGEIGGISLDTLDDVEAPNPGDGDALVWNTAAGAWIPGGASTVVLVDTSANKPTNPTDGLLWFNTDAGILYVWEDNNANWIDVRPGPDSVIQAQGYDYDGVIKIEDLSSAVIPNNNDQFIVEQIDDQGVKTTRSISWQDMMRPLIDGGLSGGGGQPGQDGQDGRPGRDGQDGQDGVGVPAGGTTGQVLSKINNTDYNTQWINAPTGSGGSGLQSRTTTSATTASLADDASENVNITSFAKTAVLFSVQTSAAAWVTLYTTAADRTADASRAETADPAPGSGVLAEVITTGAQTVSMTPSTIVFNGDTSPTDTIYAKVVNKSGGTTSVTVTMSYLQLES